MLRALAAFGVLAGHAYALSGRALPVRAERWYDVPLLFGTSGVWLFFGLSGYVISKPFVDRLLTGRPLPELVPYALRRALRIFPLYWVALLAVIAVAGAGSIELWQYPLHFGLLHNLVPGRQAALFSVAWTLTLEVLFYIAVPLLAMALARLRGPLRPERLARLVLFSWGASIAVMVAGDLLVTDQRLSVWTRESFPAMWQMFCPGILLAIAPHLRSRPWRRWLIEAPAHRSTLVALSLVLGLAGLLATLTPLRFGVGLYELGTDSARPLFAVAYGVIIAASLRSHAWFQRRARWALRLGLISYGIYLLHAVLLGVFVSEHGKSLVPLPHGGLVAFALHLVLLTCLTVALAAASWRWLEQPCIRLAARLSQRWLARHPPEAAQPSRKVQL